MHADETTDVTATTWRRFHGAFVTDIVIIAATSTTDAVALPDVARLHLRPRAAVP